ncbi:MAG: hypothetical protein ACFCD0_23375 [Gemmataceae bacterium]
MSTASCQKRNNGKKFSPYIEARQEKSKVVLVYGQCREGVTAKNLFHVVGYVTIGKLSFSTFQES